MRSSFRHFSSGPARTHPPRPTRRQEPLPTSPSGYQARRRRADVVRERRDTKDHLEFGVGTNLEARGSDPGRGRGFLWMLAEQYRRYAAECLAMSKRAGELGNKMALLNMAIAWTELAEQAARNQRNDVVYEPPLRSIRPNPGARPSRI
jgi:hypothetical protein